MEIKPKTIIVDINEDLVEKLTEKEKAFFDILQGKRKDYFLHMAKSERESLMKGGLDKEEEELIWKYGSTLALKYINAGYINEKENISRFNKYAKWALIIGTILLAQDYYFTTYALNRQLHIESFDGPTKYELIPASLSQINNSKQVINDASNLMDVSTYKNYISQPNFKCGELKSLLSSFYSPDGLPLCKKTKDGDIFVAGYVVNPTFAEPIVNVIHEGKLFNLDLSKDAGMGFLSLPGAETVTFKNIPYAFQKAFPEVVREESTNVVTKSLEN